MNLRKVKLKSVYVNANNKNGEMYIDKKGFPYHVVVIHSETGKTASTRIWHNQPHLLQLVSSWRPGTEIEVEIIEEGQYASFNIPEFTPVTENRVRELIKEGIEEYKRSIKPQFPTRQNDPTMSTPVGDERPISLDDINF